jgi:ATP-binding cassette, subfamily C, bacterial
MTVVRRQRSSFVAFCRQFWAAAPREVFIAGTLAIALGLTDGITALLLLPLLEATGINVLQGSIGRLSVYVRSGFTWLHLQPTLGTALAIFVAANIARSVLAQWRMMASVRAGNALVVALRTRVYAGIARANWLYLARHRSADFVHVLTDELTRVYALTYELLNVVSGSVVSVVYVGLAARISPLMTFGVLISGGVVVGILSPTILKSQREGGDVSQATKRLWATITELVASVKTAKSYSAEQRHIDTMEEVSKELAATGIQASLTAASSYFWFDVGSVVALALLVYIGLTRFALTPAAVLMLVYLVARVMPRVALVQRGVQFVAHMLPSFEAIIDLEQQLAVEQEHPAPSSELIPLRQSVRLENVTFAYNAPDRPAIEGLTLDIRRDSLTAIVGPSGSGKSTVADIVTGLQRPQIGHVTIDGRVLDDSLIASWRKEIGYVSQDTFIFHDTVRANLLWASPTASDQDIAEAIQMAQADFVFRLENGLDTVLGDRGVRLSGGERQRLALARALLRRPQLLVLDEPTSALDVENERHILDAILRLKGRVTTLLITHRLSAVRRADAVYVIENSHLVESGSWETLSQSEGSRFRALANAADEHPPAETLTR